MKNLLFLLGAALLIGASSCTKDDHDHDHDHNHTEVTINILSPTANAAVAQADSVVVRVELIAGGGDLHDVDIELKEGGRDVAPFPQNVHEHVSNYTFEQEVDLSSYPSGTTFELHVHACKDHDCSEHVDKEITFTIP